MTRWLSSWRITASRWQHGPSFEADIVGPEAHSADPPAWWTPPAKHTRDYYVLVKSVTAKRRKLLTVAGALGGATAGLYGLSWASRAAYEGSYSNGLYYTTNGTVVATGATGAAAVGVLTAALLTPTGR